jgi:hypothetical protein
VGHVRQRLTGIQKKQFVLVQKILTEFYKIRFANLPGYLAGMVLPPPDRRFDIEIRTAKSVVTEHWQRAAHLYGSQVCRAEIFLVLYKKKITAEKMLQKFFLWCSTVSNSAMQI